MPLVEIQNGSLADPDIVNGNFDYLDDRITDTANRIYTNNTTINSRITNLQTYLEGQISANINVVNGSIDTINEFLDALDARIDELEESPFPIPEKTALIDWENMAFKANVADVRNINNTTTGIKAYGGDYNVLHSGDIYLKEDFTNYERLMVVWCDDSGAVLNSTIIETWALDFLLSQSKGRTSLINQQYAANYYWGVWGYEYSATISSVQYQTNKKFFFCNGQQNCGIVEIYGLKNNRGE